ncbi:hypothetical protein VPH35_096555 [Triticum aestivum]
MAFLVGGGGCWWVLEVGDGGCIGQIRLRSGAGRGRLGLRLAALTGASLVGRGGGVVVEVRPPLLWIFGALGAVVGGASGGWSVTVLRFSPLDDLGGKGASGSWQGCLPVLLLPGVATATWPWFEKWHNGCSWPAAAGGLPSSCSGRRGPVLKKGSLFQQQRQWTMLRGLGWSWMPGRRLWWWERGSRGWSSLLRCCPVAMAVWRRGAWV